MAIYKGIEIEESLAGIIRFMQGVEDYREVLGKLQSSWDILVLLGQLTGAATEMSGTREAFQALTGDLISHLGKETKSKTISALSAKAQISIDILVRNLFERTADIGFLSADDDVRLFLTGQTRRVELENRFQEYVNKYSVYSDIVLFDPRGYVRARLKPHELERSKSTLLDQVGSTSQSFVEYFGAADFLSAGNHLVYAYRVEEQGALIGILALVFRLENEMRGIYKHLLRSEDFTLLATLTSQGEVVASSCAIQLPVGSVLPIELLSSKGEIYRLAGREYLALVCDAHGYQGYAGPGWKGLGMIPVDHAFERISTSLLEHLDPEVRNAVMSHPRLFSDELRQIPVQAERIQADLNRSVWNGSVRQVESNQTSSGFAKTLLWEISNTGRKTQAIFDQSIGNLHQTVVATLLQRSESQAAFAIDVMDRNLYERANDCRWWALNATFRRVLSKETVPPEDKALCGEVLAYINGLYSVYDSLVLFDTQGCVQAVSKPERRNWLGSRLTETWVQKVQGITGSQGYVISEFQASLLYDQKPTYVYAAAIKHPTESRWVGGIGVVFDSAPQFEAMLKDSLPVEADNQTVQGAFALFVRPDGRVIASSTENYPVGSRFSLAFLPRKLASGERYSHIVCFGDIYYAVGVAMSSGYREYKTSDGHIDEVMALCAYPLGAVAKMRGGATTHLEGGKGAAMGQARRVGTGVETVDVATFYVGRMWLGIPAAEVVEAIDVSGITPAIGGGNPIMAGVKMYRGTLIPIVYLYRLIGPEGESELSGGTQVVVLRFNEKEYIGLLVDRLGEIPEIAKEEIQPMPSMANGGNVLTVGVVNCAESGHRNQGRILSLLSAERIQARLNYGGGIPTLVHRTP